MDVRETNEAEAVALRALGWTLSDDARASRLLAITGLTPETLRTRLGERELLAALLRFLEAHEPDLLACAAELELTPSKLVESRRILDS
jgi:Protein of unknown function (DUF3572)